MKARAGAHTCGGTPPLSQDKCFDAWRLEHWKARTNRGCWDPSNGVGSLGACLRVHSVAPAGASVGILVTALDLWVRACGRNDPDCPVRLLPPEKQYLVIRFKVQGPASLVMQP